MAQTDQNFFEGFLEAGVTVVVAGAIVVVSGIVLADVTPDDGPWIGSWLDDVFRSQRSIGWWLIGFGVLLAAVSIWHAVYAWRKAKETFKTWTPPAAPPSPIEPLPSRTLPSPRVSSKEPARDLVSKETLRAVVQRRHNPPFAPKPDWGQTLRGLGFFAAVVAAVWYRAGAPPVGAYELIWLRDGIGAYGTGVVVLVGTIVAWWVLTAVSRQDVVVTVLKMPLVVASWLVSQVALAVGALVLAVITGAGVGLLAG